MSSEVLVLVLLTNFISIYSVLARNIASNHASSVGSYHNPDYVLYQNNYPFPNPYNSNGLKTKRRYHNTYHQHYYPKLYSQKNEARWGQNAQTREIMYLYPDPQYINRNKWHRSISQNTNIRKSKAASNSDQLPNQFPQQYPVQNPFYPQLVKKPTVMYDPETGEIIPIHPDEEERRYKSKKVSKKHNMSNNLPTTE